MSDGNDQPKSVRFVRAEIERINVKRVAPTPVVVVGDELGKLVAFLPGVGTGRKSDLAGSWIPGWEVRLHRADGRIVTVRTDSRMEHWNEGNGDWRVEEGFAPFVNELMRAHAGARSATTRSAETEQ